MLKVFAELNDNQLGEAVGDRPHHYPGDDRRWVSGGEQTENDLFILPPRYDPTQMEEWQRFRNQTIGDSAMLSAQNKVCSDETSRMRSDSDAFRITS